MAEKSASHHAPPGGVQAIGHGLQARQGTGYPRRIAAQPGSPRWHAVRYPWRLVVAIGIVLGVVGGLAAPASAHATLVATTPPAGADLTHSPGHIVLRFDQRVEVSFGDVRVYDSAERRVDGGGATHPGGDARAVAVAVPAGLAQGGYVVTWRVVSADAHPVHGAFTFSINPTPGSAAAHTGAALGAETSRLLSASSGSRAVSVVYGLLRFLAFAGVALAVGGTCFAVAIWPGARDNPLGRRLIWLGFATLVVATAMAFAIQGPYAGDLPLRQALKPGVLDSVWHTHFGRVMVARLVLLAAAAPLLRAALRHPADAAPAITTMVGGGVLGALVLGTWGAAGHAGVGSIVPVSLPFDAVHIGAASVWIGGLAMMTFVALPAARFDGDGRGGALGGALPAFSQWALGATIALAVTGAFAAWQQAGSWGAVTATSYGRLLIAKTIAFGVLLMLAAMSRRVVRNHSVETAGAVRSAGPGAMAASAHLRLATALGRGVRSELAIAVAVLAITSWLVEAQPAKQAYAAPFSAQVRAGPDYVNVVVDPAKAGPLSVHLYILSSSGVQVPVPEVTATVGDPGGGISDVTVPLTIAGPGHYAAYGIDIPVRGTWLLVVRVRVDNIDEYVTQAIRVQIH